MIRITIEMLPHGDEAKAYTMQTMEIINDGTGSAELGNYVARLHTEYGDRSGRLLEFKRRRQSVWSLVGAFLKLFGHAKHSPRLMRRT